MLPCLRGSCDLELKLDAQTVGWLRELARRGGCSAEDVLAGLVEAEIARQAAPAPASLDGREAVDGRELATGAWRVLLAAAAEPELNALPPALQRHVEQLAAQLAADPLGGRPAGGHYRAGFRHAGTQWRVVYAVDPERRTVRVLLATTRENAVY